LVLAYPLDETFGTTVYDYSGNSNDGTVNSPNGQWTTGKFNGAYQGSSSSRRIDTPLVLNSAPITVMGWFNWDGTDNRHALGTYSDASTGFHWKAYSSAIRVGVAGCGGDNYGSLASGVWTHVALVIDTSGFTVYQDGSNVGGESGTPSLNTEYFRIAAIPKYLTGFNWNGKIDEVFVFESALSQPEIQDIKDNYGFATTNYPDHLLVRKYVSPEPSHGDWGSEERTEPVTPSVLTDDPSDFGIDYATFHGEISDTGDTSCDERGFEWGYSSGDYTESWTETGTFGTGSFSHIVTGLQKDAIVYFRAKAHNNEGWGYGQEKFFSTKQKPITEIQSEFKEGIVYTISSPPRLLNLPIGELTGAIIEEISNDAAQTIPGLEGGKVIYLGSEPRKIILSYRMRGENVPQDLANVQVGETYWLNIDAHYHRWFSSAVMVDSKRTNLARGMTEPFLLLSLEVSEAHWKNANIKTEFIENVAKMKREVINITSAYTEEVVNMQREAAVIESDYEEAIV